MTSRTSLKNWPRFVFLAVLLLCLGSICAAPASAQQINEQAVDASIARSLEFLASQQQPNGSWRTDSWGDSTAITSLAVMSFMAAGHVPGEGPYGDQITRAVMWVVSLQEQNGMLINSQRTHGPMYSHGICTLMLAEVCGMMPDSDAPVVRRALERAIRLILQSQAYDKNDRHQGGWRYQIDSRDSDLSVTGWQVMALRAAKDIGCDVPADAIDGAVGYVKACGVRENRGFGYQPGNGPTPTLTGTGIMCLEVCGAHHTEEAMGGANWLLANPLRERDSYFYYGVYYTGVGMYKMGGDFADNNRRHLIETLLPIQDADGGWTPTHGSERGAGRIYSTSLAVLALAIDYGYLPIYQR
ncbi:MAG: terpene cyclase/mutase family protein [Planctomycetaceae bacterium]|nr:terpene cyclase/mutase family protein [Planctomycetaceae bacterium]